MEEGDQNSRTRFELLGVFSQLHRIATDLTENETHINSDKLQPRPFKIS
jgi:hypothetical protein